MSFEKGSISFRVFRVGGRLGEDAVGKFAGDAAPPIGTLGASPVEGWVSWRHPFDREITAETCYFRPWLHLNHLRAEKKVPPALLRAYSKMEEDVERRARGGGFLPRKARAEIKERVREQLRPDMPPSLSAMDVAVDLEGGLVFAEALSDGNIDRFARSFKATTGEQPVLMTPEAFALSRKRVDHNALPPASFADAAGPDDAAGCDLGLEFLTWLWYHWEVEGGAFAALGGTRCGYMLEGPVTFHGDGGDAGETLFRKGEPLSGREPFTAILCGKKLKQAKLALAAGENVWNVTVDSGFCFRGLKLPKDPENPYPSFADRMHSLGLFLGYFLDLYDAFVALRADREAWGGTQRGVREWALGKAAGTRGGGMTAGHGPRGAGTGG